MVRFWRKFFASRQAPKASANQSKPAQQPYSRSISLFDAVERLQLETVTAFVARGVDVNAKRSDGRTALMLACRAQADEITRVLIEGGSHVNAKDSDGVTALILACRAGLGLDEIQLLLDRGAKINATTNAGENALMGAVSHDYLDIAKFLIERGADIRAVDIDGESARDKARRSRAVHTASLLDSYLK